MIEYCPKCKRDTEHKEVKEDEFFIYATRCIVCNITWECSHPEGHPEVEIKAPVKSK